MPSPRPSPRGVFMRRHDCGTGRGVPAGRFAPGARGGVGLPSGSLRSPARSWLTTVRSIPNATRHLSRGRGAKQDKRRGSRDTHGESGAGADSHRTWRAGRRPPVFGSRAIGFALFGAPSPACLADTSPARSFALPAFLRHAGLVPGIHDFLAANEDVDGRVKPGHDERRLERKEPGNAPAPSGNCVIKGQANRPRL